MLPVLALATLASCDSFIYEDEGDCDPYYKVRFVYDRNLKYSDAFAAEVNEVTLYIVDTDGAASPYTILSFSAFRILTPPHIYVVQNPTDFYTDDPCTFAAVCPEPDVRSGPARICTPH